MATCPRCHKAIYNRRSTSCEFCGQPIPKALLLSEVQKTALDELKERERKRFSAWKEDLDRKTDHSDGDGFPG